jgi:hypothetical protein
MKRSRLAAKILDAGRRRFWLRVGCLLLLATCDPAFSTAKAQGLASVASNLIRSLVFTDCFGDLNDDGKVDELDIVQLNTTST